MILVDSSLWIDYFNGKETADTTRLHNILGVEPILIGDLILVEVLQGFKNTEDLRIARKLLLSLPYMDMVGKEIALKSALNYRFLKQKGISIRKTIDVIIATFCLHHHIVLFHNDRDFNPMVKWLGLQVF